LSTSAVTVWTVGHSTHPVPALVGVLQGQRIEVLADVRSQPYSRRNPQFNRESFAAAAHEAGLEYLYLGAELGGRPPEPEFYDGRGHVRYAAVAATARFASGLERLLARSAGQRVAIMCSEEDPARCHRRLLVGRALAERGVTVSHIRGDGSVVDEAKLGPVQQDMDQGTLFG
jgi:uncharacterized protein (DUF488 family)